MTRRPSRRLVLLVILALAIGLAAGLSPVASSSPDGLSRVAADQGFADRERTGAAQRGAPAADYRAPGVGDDRLATGLAGFAGTLLVGGPALGLGTAVRRRRWAPAPTPSS